MIKIYRCKMKKIFLLFVRISFYIITFCKAVMSRLPYIFRKYQIPIRHLKFSHNVKLPFHKPLQFRQPYLESFLLQN